VRQKAVLLLQTLHGDAVGDEQHVGLGLPGLELGAELGKDLRGAVANEGDVDARVLRLEGIERLLGVGVGLTGIKDEVAGQPLRLSEGGHEGGEHGKKNPLHGHGAVPR
jgi:hypothetical protein